MASFNAEQEEESTIDTRPRRHYIIVRLVKEGERFEVAGIRTVPYKTVRPFSQEKKYIKFIRLSIRYLVIKQISTPA